MSDTTSRDFENGVDHVFEDGLTLRYLEGLPAPAVPDRAESSWPHWFRVVATGVRR